MKLKFSIAANAKAVTLGKYIDYQNAVDKVEQVRIITGKSSESIGAIELGFIPNLNELTFGEYIDLDTHCGSIYKDGKINGEAAHKMMCILYRPIKAKFGKYYDIESYNPNAKRKYEDEVLQLTLDHVLNVLLFFSSLEIELYNSSLEYLAKEITEIVKEMKEQPQTA